MTGVQMRQMPNFLCKRSQHHLHSRMNECTRWSQCRHLYATRSPLPARLAWKVIHFIPRDKWSHRLLAPFRRQTESCVKEIHFGTFNNRSAGGQLMYVISSVSWLRSPSDSLAALFWSERICRPHHVVKTCSLLRITYNQYRLQGCGRDHAAFLSAKWRALPLVFQCRCVQRTRIYHLTPWKCWG